MKKTVIIAAIALLAVAGVTVTRLAVHKMNSDSEAGSPVQQVQETEQVQQTSEPSPIVEAPTSTPEVEKTKEPAEEVQTEEPEATEEPTATPTTEAEEPTKAPEVDYSQLSDSELTKEIVRVITNRHATVKKMTKKEKIVYAAYVFNNDAGSIYGYLTGSGNVTAAYLTDSLKAIGATCSAELFEDFANTSHMKLSDAAWLSKMSKDEYHFDIFNEEYAEIAKEENISSLLASYIKENLEDLK